MYFSCICIVLCRIAELKRSSCRGVDDLSLLNRSGLGVYDGIREINLFMILSTAAPGSWKYLDLIMQKQGHPY